MASPMGQSFQLPTPASLLTSSNVEKSAQTPHTSSDSVRSRYGLKANVEHIKAGDDGSAKSLPPPYDVWDTELPNSSAPMALVERCGLPAHPSNLGLRDPEGSTLLAPLASSTDFAKTTSRREPVPRSNNPFREAMITQRRWAEPLCVGPISDHHVAPASYREGPLQQVEDYFYRKGGKIPAISDLDWSKADEEDLGWLFETYNGDHHSSSSRHDSAVAFEDKPKPNYSGKGKGHTIDSAEAIHQMGAALDYAGSPEVKWQSQLLRQEHEEAAEYAKREADDRAAALALQRQLEREQEEEERLAAERSRLRDCAVCGDTRDPLEFPAKAATGACEHPPRTCKGCPESWMASEYDTKGTEGVETGEGVNSATEGIKCPECSEVLSYEVVQRAASSQTFEAYDNSATRNALAALSGFAWCLGSNCTSGQVNEENDNFMECVSCGYKQCLKHKVPWHTAETCTQYECHTSGQKAKDEEWETEAMLDSVSKKCPGQKCGWRIQKTDGCDHMTCK